MSKLPGIENAFVSDCEGWDDLGTMVLGLYDPVLLPNVFPIDITSNPDTLTLDGGSSTVTLSWYDEEGDVSTQHTFKIKLQLLEEITE